ncbi:MAG: MFS transporter [Pseudomonadota bacterium]
MLLRLWILIICAGAILGLSMGIRQGMGLFLTPISLHFGSGREAFALSMGLMNLFWGAAAPVAGAIADRYGAARVAAAGGVAYAAGLLVMMLSNSSDQLILGGVLVGLGLSGAAFTVVLGAVGRATPEHMRSRALGLVSVGGSIGQLVALPYIHVMIDGFGWLVALGLLSATALLIVPLAFGLATRTSQVPAPDSQSLSEALRSASRVPSFWLLNAGFLACGFHLAFIGVHLPGFLADKGFDTWLAAAALATVGFTNIIGVYICGVLGDLYAKKNVLSVLYLVRTALILMFILTPVSEVSVLLFSAFMGFLWLGTVPLTSGLVGSLFGTRYMSMLFGIVFMGHQVGGFLGAWLAGIAFDRFGSYDVMWWLSIGLGLIAAALHWPIKEHDAVQPALRAENA